MEKRFNLPQNIDKYMYFMEFIKSASPLTLKHYGLDLRQAFGENDSQELSEDELLTECRLAFNRWARLSLSSRNRKAATLKSFLGWAFQENLLSRDLSLQITCPKVPKKIPHFLSVDEALAVLKALNTEGSLQEQTLFSLLYGGGLRVSEACQLRWVQVFLKRQELRVLGKGKKERVIVLPTLSCKYLEKIKKTSMGETYIWGNSPLDSRVAYNMVRRSGQRAGLLKPLHPHALRHSFATHLLSSGTNLRTLQEMLGHESLQATEKYTHLGIDQLARTMEDLHPLGKKNST